MHGTKFCKQSVTGRLKWVYDWKHRKGLRRGLKSKTFDRIKFKKSETIKESVAKKTLKPDQTVEKI